MYSFLSLLDENSWKWEFTKERRTELNAGERIRLLDITSERGWFMWGLLTAFGDGAENAEFSVGTDSQIRETSIDGMREAGTNNPRSGVPSITRYDTDNDIYGVAWEPVPPIPYKDRSLLTLRAPPQKDIVISSDIAVVRVLDEELFKQSYREVVTGNMEELIGEIRGLREDIQNAGDLF